ncbi:MAG: penicillin-binding transpeptidase domain-containing protein, partial [Rikenellaceae bacterium]
MLDRKSNSNSRNTAPEPSQEAQEQSLYAPVAPTPEEQWNKHVTRVMRRRTNSMVAIFVCLAIISILGVVWIKGGPRSEELSAKAQQYSFREEIVEASRGDILSDDYRVLTTSISYYELRMDLNAAGLTDTLFNGNVEQLSVQLSEFLGDSTAQVYHDRLVEARKRRNGYFRLSFKKVNYLELREIRKFALLNLPPNVGGFIPQEMERRVNPYGALASRTIGFINRNGVKVGIEGSFDEYLRGSNGAMVKQKVSGSFWIPVNSPFNIEPVNGANVVTTLDIDIQDIAQRALIQQVDEVRADWGCAIVMEVATGEIKAMANITRESSGEMYEDYNYAIGMSLDPGSTFKLPVMMALLEDGGFSLSSMVDAGSGREQVGYATVRD